MGLGGVADLGDLLGRDNGGLVAPGVADKGKDGRDLVVFERVTPGHHRSVKLLAIDRDLTRQAVENDANDAVGAFGGDPIRAGQGWKLAGKAQAIDLVAGDTA